MRVIVAVAALTLSLVGCSTNSQPASPSATDAWHVVPLNPPLNPANSPEGRAILLNEQTGDTWLYSSDQRWHQMMRN